MYYRVTRYNFDPAKYDDLMAYADSIKPKLRSIPGLNFGHEVRTGEDSGMVIAQYASAEAAEAAQSLVSEILSEFGRYMTSAPQIHAGTVIWSTDD